MKTDTTPQRNRSVEFGIVWLQVLAFTSSALLAVFAFIILPIVAVFEQQNVAWLLSPAVFISFIWTIYLVGNEND